MLVRLTREFRGYKLGKVLDCGGGEGDVLVRRKIAEPVGDRDSEKQSREQKAKKNAK